MHCSCVVASSHVNIPVMVVESGRVTVVKSSTDVASDVIEAVVAGCVCDGLDVASLVDVVVDNESSVSSDGVLTVVVCV